MQTGLIVPSLVAELNSCGSTIPGTFWLEMVFKLSFGFWGQKTGKLLEHPKNDSGFLWLKKAKKKRPVSDR